MEDISENEDIAKAFPGLKFDKPIVEEEPKVVYLWDTSLKLYEIHCILRKYLNEYYSLDTAVLLRLIDAKHMDVEDTLFKLPYLHSGYTEILIEHAEETSDD